LRPRPRRSKRHDKILVWSHLRPQHSRLLYERCIPVVNRYRDISRTSSMRSGGLSSCSGSQSFHSPALVADPPFVLTRSPRYVSDSCRPEPATFLHFDICLSSPHLHHPMSLPRQPDSYRPEYLVARRLAPRPRLSHNHTCESAYTILLCAVTITDGQIKRRVYTSTRQSPAVSHGAGSEACPGY
jgi:hypothetical protein